ncbi:tripartite tricarboxylate transporter substrate binding protein [Verticiella sediminum]|uniref:Tripartite tricarboxylate transporter substrate binding protein n=1 Tax=Verticiella sediminum TaxID=1247510 RepID=A0A556AJE6_9BURK|nr:tripartite tricarboxylate transporter substrate binding protein [Verticiella sediminum]TSH92990.1 tripartite tricarboxylate transporter substrate binding protein [Verticiella sediminum]
MSKMNCIAAALAALTVGVAAVPAHAADDFPSKPITVLVGFAPGGPTDAIGRVVFRRVSELLGKPVIIENKPGAGGNIASQELVRAKADGYTLLYAASSMATATALYHRDDLNPKTEMTTAGCSVAVPLLLLTARKVGKADAASFFQQMQGKPGSYFLGSSGTGSMDHLVALDIANRLKTSFQHVPYRGNGPALTDVASDNVDFMYSGAFNSALPFIQSGQVTALAVTSAHRSPSLPNVPTLSESVSGLEGYEAGTWQVLMAPKGTPAAVLDKLNNALQEALKDPEVQKSLKFQAAEPMGLDRAECRAFVGKEFDRWSATIGELGIKPD